MQRTIEGHLGSHQVARVVYGAIVGLALIVALEEHPPGPGVVAATLLGTAVAVGLAELFSDLVGAETRLRRSARGPEVRSALDSAAAVAFGIASPVVFFVLAAAHVLAEDTAFAVAKWAGVGMLGFYGFCAGRLAGGGMAPSLLRALAAALTGAFLVALKALLH